MKLLQLICLTLVLALLLPAQGMPRLASVEPGECKAGAEVTATGENLDKAAVAEIYLTDGKNDIKMTIMQQTGTNIKFKLPADAKAGRFSLMLLTAGADPKLIEQPVKVTVQ